jgi:hypothetical protein
MKMERSAVKMVLISLSSLLIGFILYSLSIFFAAAEESGNSVRLVPKITSVFPIFIGAGPELIFNERYQIGINYGVTPQPYYSTIGQVAASVGGNPSYKDVIQASFQNNALWRVGFQYNFNTSQAGWCSGLSISRLTSTGKAGIDEVLRAATGKDFTQLKNLLTAAGRSTDVELDGTLIIAEISGGYSWDFMTKASITLTGGVAKVVKTDIRLKTGLPNFEATNLGNSLMRSSEDEIESIVNKYGLFPTVGVGAGYYF